MALLRLPDTAVATGGTTPEGIAAGSRVAQLEGSHGSELDLLFDDYLGSWYGSLPVAAPDARPSVNVRTSTSAAALTVLPPW